MPVTAHCSSLRYIYGAAISLSPVVVFASFTFPEAAPAFKVSRSFPLASCSNRFYSRHLTHHQLWTAVLMVSQAKENTYREQQFLFHLKKNESFEMLITPIFFKKIYMKYQIFSSP